MKILHIIATILVIIGALNWGLVGALDKNLVTTLFGDMPNVVKAIYILVGLSGIYKALVALGVCKHCHTKEGSCH